MCRISVIIPVYNGEKWLGDCVSSLASQSFTDFEMILVNDGSTDGSEALCRHLAEKDGRIRVLNKENGGAASARNLGLNKAVGDYIAFVDADDTVDRDFLLRLYEAAEEKGADIAMCDYIKQVKDSSFPFSQPIRGGFYNREDIEKELFPCLIMLDNLEFPPTISNWVCLFKRSLLEDNGLRYPAVWLCEDSFFGSVALYNARGFVYLKGQALYNYLYHDGSVSHTNDPGKRDRRWGSFLKINEEYDKYFGKAHYDFSMQIKHNMLYFTMNQLSYIRGCKMGFGHFKMAVKELIKEPGVRRAFKRFKYPAVPFKLKLNIFLIKHRLALAYCLLHR